MDEPEQSYEPCRSCDGSGGYEDYDGNWQLCSTCDGDGDCLYTPPKGHG